MASSNKFYSEIYAKLYKTLIHYNFSIKIFSLGCQNSKHRT